MKFTFILTLLLTSICVQARLPELSELQQEVLSVNWDKSMSRSIIIHAPIKVVWDYASDSTRANQWSVYFDHISPLPGPPDGTIGSLRRCFRNSDESGARWDEITIGTRPLESRNIVSYNFVDYPLNFVARREYAFVRQLYRAIDENTTEMSFQTQLAPGANWKWKILFTATRKETGGIFYDNLENIKAAIEGNPRPNIWR